MQDYDVVLKVLLQRSVERLTGYRITRSLPTELPKSKISASICWAKRLTAS